MLSISHECNLCVILCRFPQSTIALQRVLNAAARVVCGLRPWDHVTDALIGLHWLPVGARTYRVSVCTVGVQGAKRSCTVLHHRYVTTCHNSWVDRHVTLRLAGNNDLFICSFPEVVSVSMNVLFGLQLLEVRTATQASHPKLSQHILLGHSVND